MGEFLLDWYRVLDDQEDYVSERQRERILFKKIGTSRALHDYIAHYKLMPDDHPDHSHAYLVNSMETYLAKNLMNQMMQSHEAALKGENEEPSKRRNNRLKGAAAQHRNQCPFWLKPSGCRDPSNCELGYHDGH